MYHNPFKYTLYTLKGDFKVKIAHFLRSGYHNLKNTWIHDLKSIANDSALKPGAETLSRMSELIFVPCIMKNREKVKILKFLKFLKRFKHYKNATFQKLK